MKKEKETKEAFLAGAEWILKEIDEIHCDEGGQFSRLLNIKMYPIREKYQQIKKLKI